MSAVEVEDPQLEDPVVRFEPVDVIDGPTFWRQQRHPRIRIALVSGLCTTRDSTKWWHWTFVGKGLPRTLTPFVSQARLFSFTRRGQRAGLIAAYALKKQERSAAKVFCARVVVTGDWFEPLEVVEAWRLENPRPVPVKYVFED
jgi:hypothetical protein